MNWNQRIKELLTGEWVIASKVNNNKVLDVNGNDGSYNVRIWDKSNADNQKWTVEFDSTNRAFVIRSVAYRNKVLARISTNKAAGVNVIVSDYGTNNPIDMGQRWYLHYNCNDYYTLANYVGDYLNPMVLDLYGSNTNNGANIQVFPFHGKDNQCFSFIRQ
ncbi:hypothetical protein C3495_13795 (plasmid) [Clostridiaceae bacterium 14S0207]|nr:hypothetical protein C3495_13795 [Clostridiaceae bacterium 14S0207]